MSEINSFSDYTSKYNSNVDYSALFGGTSDNSVGGTNLLSDYASIKNGSYSDTISKLFESTIDEKVGDKDKDKSWWEKELEKKEEESNMPFSEKRTGVKVGGMAGTFREMQ